MRTFGILTGYWSTNIGNSFFQLGARHILSRLFPEDRHVFLADQPGYAFPHKGTPKNSFDIVAHTPMDYCVITGPFLRPEFHQILLPTMEALAAKGTRFVCLGIGMMKYDDETVRSCHKVLEKLPIDVFTTRDRPTYDRFKDVCPNTYDGIDLAFFLGEQWDKSVGLDIGPYVVMNFDQIPEPEFVPVEGTVEGPVAELGGKRYSLRFPETRKKLSDKGTMFQILERMLSKPALPDQIGDFAIVRSDHRYNPVILDKIYTYPRTVSADIPWPYMQLYANCDTVFSNRVHACVASLAFGNKAMLFSKTPRAYLLERIGATTIKEKPAQLDMAELQREKDSLEAVIAKALAPK